MLRLTGQGLEDGEMADAFPLSEHEVRLRLGSLHEIVGAPRRAGGISVALGDGLAREEVS